MPIGTVSSSRCAGEHEAADVLRQVARKADQLVGKRDRLPDRRIGGIEPGVADVVVGHAFVLAPYRLGERRGDVLGQAQSLADLADGAAGAVMDDGCADRGAVAPVTLVDVLDHLLAPLVLEIDVDVGRLAAILGNEAGEEEIAFFRVHRGDAEAIADGAVRRRAAALAEDFLFLPAREGDDVVDGEEVARVVEPGDERELLRKPVSDIGRNAFRISVLRIALLRSRPGQIFEMLLGGLACRHRFVGIFVFELAEREAAGFGDREGAGDGLGKVLEQPRHLRGGFEMPFGIDGESQASLAQRAFLADAGEHIDERPALRDVIGHIVDGDERRVQARAELGEKPETARLVAAMIMHAGEERAARRRAAERREPLGESTHPLPRSGGGDRPRGTVEGAPR